MRCLNHLRWPVIVAALTWALSGAAPAQTNNLIIYHDGLRNGFADWSWAERSLICTNPVHSGSIAISVSANPWQGLYIRHSHAVNITNYDALSLWLHGGDPFPPLFPSPLWGGVRGGGQEAR